MRHRPARALLKRFFHRNLHSLHRCLLAFIALTLTAGALADVSLPRLLSDGAVLQRDKPVTIWGWAAEGEKVRVEFAGKTQTTVANDGSWSVHFPAMKAGGPYELTVTGNNKLKRSDLLLGDVWIAAGQSNMELPLSRVATRYPDLIANTELPQVRSFNFPTNYAFKGPAADYPLGDWKAAVPANLPGFSAVGFFFMRDIHQHEQVPVGLISIPIGGSPVEAWMSEAALAPYPHYLAQVKPFKDDAHVQATIAKDKAASDSWYKNLAAADKGIANKWAEPSVDTNDWQTINMPAFFAEQGSDFKNGVVWLRRSVMLSKEQAVEPAILWLGAMVDGDEVYINGTLVGQTGYQYPPRIYKVPQGLLHAGRNTISIRLTSYSGHPGFVKDKRYALQLGNKEISLQGPWQYRVGATAPDMQPTTTLHYLPTSLYNARLAPALPMGIKGVIWFQGESNVERPDAQGIKLKPAYLCEDEACAVYRSEYRYLFSDLIVDWRKQFDQGDFPFLFVQLANFLPASDEPTESNWAKLREAQRQTLAVKNTGMAVAIDVGEWNDIHPLNKEAVGHRLALLARKQAYGEKNLLASGPRLTVVKRDGNKLVLRFTNVGQGLKIQGERLQRMAIAGDDKKFVWADAEVKKDRVVLSAPNLEKPVWVRYAWADNPAGANLYNSGDLPASPFEARVKR